MDKLKPILIKLKRHHFWIVIVLVLGVSAYCWASSVKKLKSEAQSQQSKIKSSFDQVQRSGDDGPRRASHPNAKFEEGMKELITSRQGEVLAAWESQVQQQQSILQWPQNLGDDFVAAVAKLPPVEKMVFPEPKEQDVEVKFRERFRNYIQDELPKLAEMIGSKWDADQSGGEAAPAGSGFGFGHAPAAAAQPDDEQIDDDLIVNWDAGNQTAIRDKRFDWKGSPDQVPSTLQMVYAQEDLWVLTALMQIIQNTNGGATARHNAVIREIEQIQIGKDAVSKTGKITRLGGNAPGAASSGGGGHGAPSGGAPSAHGGGGGRAPTGPDPAEGRYVNKDYQPLPAGVLRSGGAGGGAEQAYLAVARRIPVRLIVGMDHRQINKLLIECANSPLKVEVRQLRLHQKRSGSADGKTVDKFPYDRNVEVYGIVYIFNQVDEQRLGFTEEELAALRQARQEAPGDDATPPAEPATATPEPAATEEAATATPEDGAA